jgi:site-specific DNA-methyltransferase (adenine-specific)
MFISSRNIHALWVKSVVKKEVAAMNVEMPSIVLLDSVEWLKTLPDESVDLAITDPPYESLEKHRKMGVTTRLKQSRMSSNKWFQIFHNERFPELFNQIYRVLKKNTHFYMFCDQETMFVAKPMGEDAGFKFWKPIVWDKTVIGMGYHYRAQYEFILFFEKGKRRLYDLGIPDVLKVKRVWQGYPTEKPVPLMEILISQSSDPGELVIDPFFGSGSVGVAALNLKRRFAGSDICDEALDVARMRFEEVVNETNKQLTFDI